MLEKAISLCCLEALAYWTIMLKDRLEYDKRCQITKQAFSLVEMFGS